MTTFQPAQRFTLTNPPPSVNAMYRNVPGKGRVKTDGYRLWLEASRWELKMQAPKTIVGDVSVEISLRRPRANADLDNRAKGTIDALTGLVLVDDKQVTALTLRWADVDGVEIRVRPA